MMSLRIPPVNYEDAYCDGPLQQVAWSYLGVNTNSQ